MRSELLYNPRMMCERLAELSVAFRRRRSLRGTPASWLTDDHLGSLELVRLLSATQSAVVYDVGANVGAWTLLLKAVHPRAVVHAFEPLARHVAGFRTNVAGLKDVHLHEIALGETAAAGTMHVTSFSDASSLLPLAAAGAARWQIREVAEERVQVEPMDAWQSRTGAPFPSLIKLDVQGFELAVLRGASRCLGHAEAVLLEVSFEEFYEGNCQFADVIGFLAEHKFSLRALGRDTAVGRPLVQADALLIAGRRTATR